MTGWHESWSFLLGLGANELPPVVVALLGQMALFFFYFVPCSLFIHILDRKIGADFQARIGPSRVGMNGYAQPIADVFKLLGKQTAPESAQDRLFFSVIAIVLYSSAASYPVSQSLVFLNNDLGVFVPFGSVAAAVFISVLYGLISLELNRWYEGLRMAFRLSAGFFPAFLSLLGAGITAGGFRWDQFSIRDGSIFEQWLILRNPFQIVNLVIFVVSGFIVLGVSQFEIRPLLMETSFGVRRRAQGRSIVVVEFIRYYGFLLWCGLAVGVFLGGSSLPASLARIFEEEGWLRLRLALEVLVSTVKVFAVMLVSIWIARVNPRSRVDHLSELGWKVLSPVSILALLAVLAWEGGRQLYAQL